MISNYNGFLCANLAYCEYCDCLWFQLCHKVGKVFAQLSAHGCVRIGFDLCGDNAQLIDDCWRCGCVFEIRKLELFRLGLLLFHNIDNHR